MILIVVGTFILMLVIIYAYIRKEKIIEKNFTSHKMYLKRNDVDVFTLKWGDLSRNECINVLNRGGINLIILTLIDSRSQINQGYPYIYATDFLSLLKMGKQEPKIRNSIIDSLTNGFRYSRFEGKNLLIKSNGQFYGLVYTVNFDELEAYIKLVDPDMSAEEFFNSFIKPKKVFTPVITLFKCSVNPSKGSLEPDKLIYNQYAFELESYRFCNLSYREIPELCYFEMHDNICFSLSNRNTMYTVYLNPIDGKKFFLSTTSQTGKKKNIDINSNYKKIDEQLDELIRGCI